MRPAVTVVSLAREVWGSERSILQLAPYLDKEGIDLTLAAPDGAFARAAAECAITVVPLTLPPHGGVVDATPSAVSSACNAARELPRVLRGARLVNRAAAGADLVHCNSLLATMDCAVAGRLARRPTVLELHDLVRPGVSRTLLSVATRLAGTAVAVSSPVAAGLDRRAAARPK